MKKLAIIGDIHGCLDELQQLHKRLSWLTLDEIWCLGDFVDRGPESGGVVQYCRENYINGIFGNHEESILRLYKKLQENPQHEIQNEDKKKTLSQLKPEDAAWLEKLPILHEIDHKDQKIVLVHGGVWPSMSMALQPKNVIRCQMIRNFDYKTVVNVATREKAKTGDVRWWGPDASKHKSGRTEEQNREDGYVRWTEVYDHPHDIYFGHSVFTQPYVDNRPGSGKMVGVDTGSCFGGSLTAAIVDGGPPWFVSVKANKAYAEKGFRVHQE